MTSRTTLLGRVVTPDMQPLDGLPLLAPITSQEERHAPSQTRSLLETGIKMLDLCVPLSEGGLHQIIGGYRMGKVVLLAEVISHFAQQQQGCAVWVASAEQHAEGHHMVEELREANALQHMIFIIGQPDQAIATLQAGRTLAQMLAQEGSPVFMGIEEELVQEGTLPYLSPRDLATRIIVSHDMAHHDLPTSLATDATIVLSRTLADQQLFPAIDLSRSRSALLECEEVDTAHVRLAAAVRMALLDQPQTHRSQLLQLFCTQPFFVSEPYTAQPGVSVPLAETLQDFATILEGTYDDVPEGLLTYQGRLPVHPYVMERQIRNLG